MKYKRINISIPDNHYENWEKGFFSNSDGLSEYSCFRDIDNINFCINFNNRKIVGDSSIILNILKCSKPYTHNSSDERMFAVIITNIKQLNDIYTFIYENITYVISLQNKSLTVEDYLTRFNNLSNDFDVLESYIYTFDPSSCDEVMNICYSLIHLNCYPEYPTHTEIKENYYKRLKLIDFFLNKLSYYGYDCCHFSYIGNITKLPQFSKKEILLKQIEFVYYKFVNGDDISKCREFIENESEILYRNFFKL